MIKKKTIEQCRKEINNHLQGCDGFHLGMSCMYAQTENSYTFLASCSAHSLEKVIKLAGYHDYKIELIEGLTFRITIRTSNHIRKRESLFLRVKRTLFCIFH